MEALRFIQDYLINTGVEANVVESFDLDTSSCDCPDCTCDCADCVCDCANQN